MELDCENYWRGHSLMFTSESALSLRRVLSGQDTRTCFTFQNLCISPTSSRFKEIMRIRHDILRGEPYELVFSCRFTSIRNGRCCTCPTNDARCRDSSHIHRMGKFNPALAAVLEDLHPYVSYAIPIRGDQG